MLQLLQALFLGRECSQCSLPAEAAEFSASYTLCPADGLAASATVAIRHTAPPPPVAAGERRREREREGEKGKEKARERQEKNE